MLRGHLRAAMVVAWLNLQAGMQAADSKKSVKEPESSEDTCG